MSQLVQFTLLMAFAFIISRLISRLERALFLMSGLEYLVIGYLLSALDVIDVTSLQSFSHMISLGLGSIGLAVGLQARSDRKPRLDSDAYRGAGWTTALPWLFTLITASAWLLISRWVSFDTLDWASLLAFDNLAGILTLAAAATLSASSLLTHLITSYTHDQPRKGPMSRFLVNTSWLSELIGITLFGATVCIAHIGHTANLPRDLTSLEWFAFNLLLGLLLGALFLTFLGRERDPNRLLLALLGVVVFASGLASFFQFSPIFVCFIIGLILARDHTLADALQDKLRSIEQPNTILLLIFAGALWQPPDASGWLLTAIYLITRTLSKQLGGWMTYRYSLHPENFAPGAGLALVAQGGLTTALALNYILLYSRSPIAPTVFHCLLFCAIISELFTPRNVRHILIDAREISSLAPRTLSTNLNPELLSTWDEPLTSHDPHLPPPDALDDDFAHSPDPSSDPDPSPASPHSPPTGHAHP